jgi:leucyl/phenylalanyl-tRNA--protein transferase
MMVKAVNWLTDNSLDFPPLHNALSDPNGLLAVGGDLSPQRLIKAYQQGVFPWFNQGEAILWWSPSPRTVIELTQIRINKSLRKFLNKNIYSVSINQCFDRVIDCCANAPFRTEGTWIVDEMKQAYKDLHQLGYAHSIEVWENNQLVGGLYGVAINSYFSGESMFYLAPNASKVALVSLVQLLKNENISFIDCQMTNPFLTSMGAKEIKREDFIDAQQRAINSQLRQGFWQPRFL